jgi:hypothetical protein
MHKHILRVLMITMLTLLFSVGTLTFAMKPSYADVAFEKWEGTFKVYITNTISKGDANVVNQHAAEFEYDTVIVWLDRGCG